MMKLVLKAEGFGIFACDGLSLFFFFFAFEHKKLCPVLGRLVPAGSEIISALPRPEEFQK